MPWRAPVGKIRRPSFKKGEAPDVSWWDSLIAIPPESNYLYFSTTLQTGNLWYYASNGSLWVHTNAVILVLPKINTHFFTTLHIPKGDVPITVSPSINGSARLVSINECVIRTRSIYCEHFRPYSYSRQQDMFHTSVVGVFQFIRRQLLSGIFT